jgi:hypothetical protein
MKNVKTFEEFLNESYKFNVAEIQLAIHFLETSTNKNLAKNYKWLINQIKERIDDSSSKNVDIELNKQEYDFVKQFSELASKAYQGLDTD